MRVFGIDPGSERTGYGCVETDGRRHRLVLCGAIATAGTRRVPGSAGRHLPRAWPRSLRDCRPDCVAIESLFHAANVRSALKLGHARGVAMLAAVAGRRAGGRVHALPRSSAPWSATAAPKRRRCSR